MKSKDEIKLFNKLFFIKLSELSEKSQSLKNMFIDQVFNYAKNRNNNLSQNKRETLFKLYKKLKYNNIEEENKIKTVDPVNYHIMNKCYTQKLKLSKLERMRIISEHRKKSERSNNFNNIKDILTNSDLNKKDEGIIKEKHSIDEISLEDENDNQSEDEELEENEEDEEELELELEEENSDEEAQNLNIIITPMKKKNNTTMLNKKRYHNGIEKESINYSNGINYKKKRVIFKLANNEINGKIKYYIRI